MFNPARDIKTGHLVEIETTDTHGEPMTLRTLVEVPPRNEILTLLSPMRHGTTYPLQVGEGVTLVFLHEQSDGDLYAIEAEVSGREVIENRPLHYFHFKGEPRKIQRRTYFRLDHVTDMPLRTKDHDLTLTTKNISAGGVRGIIPKRLKAHEEVTLLWPVNGETLTIKARVLDCIPVIDSIRDHDCRLTFLNVNQAMEREIMHFLLAKQADMIRKDLEQNQYDEQQGQTRINTQDRRLDEDRMVMVYKALSAFSWFFSILLLSTFLMARPERVYGLDVFFDFKKRAIWNLQRLDQALIVELITVLISGLGLFLNSLRMKRKGDRWSRSLMINLLIGLLGIGYYLYLVT